MIDLRRLCRLSLLVATEHAMLVHLYNNVAKSGAFAVPEEFSLAVVKDQLEDGGIYRCLAGYLERGLANHVTFAELSGIRIYYSGDYGGLVILNLSGKVLRDQRGIMRYFYCSVKLLFRALFLEVSKVLLLFGSSHVVTHLKDR